MKIFRDKDYEKDAHGRQIIPVLSRVTATQADDIQANNAARIRGCARNNQTREILDRPAPMCPSCDHPFIYRRIMRDGILRWECEACGYFGTGGWNTQTTRVIAIYQLPARRS